MSTHNYTVKPVNDKIKEEGIMKRTRRVFVLLLVACCMLAPAFAQGYREAAEAEKAAAVAEALASVKVEVPPSANGGMAGVTRPEISGYQVVHAGSPVAATAGYNVLLQGGTAFDAAVAVAAAQTFAEPGMINIFGGDAEIIVYSAKDKAVKVYNGTGWAPEKADVLTYFDLGGIPSSGVHSMQIPGEWSGWMTLLNDYGTMDLESILAPVVDVAENGTAITPFLDMILKMSGTSKYNDEAKNVFTRDGKILAQGDLYVNKNYAKLLKEVSAVAAKGKTNQEGYKLALDYFYRGPIAEKIVAWNQNLGGLFTIEDFTSFNAEIQEPLTTNYRGYDVYACPPNSQGAALIEALNLAEQFDISSYEHNSSEYINLIAQIMTIALNDRNKYVSDPRFGTMPPELMTKEYAKKMAEYINHDGMLAELPDGGLVYARDYEALGGDTTFMAVADKYGNVVCSTHSINGIMGSGLMVDGLGIMMNNRMVYYSLDEEHPNCLAPHKRTLQTITPSLALKDGVPAFFVGTPGSDNQEQTKFQVILNYVDFGFKPQQDVEKARMVSSHAPAAGKSEAFPGKISVMGVGSKVIDELTAMGYKVSKTTNTGSLGFGLYDPQTGLWTVGADPTRDAYTVGW